MPKHSIESNRPQFKADSASFNAVSYSIVVDFDFFVGTLVRFYQRMHGRTGWYTYKSSDRELDKVTHKS